MLKTSLIFLIDYSMEITACDYSIENNRSLSWRKILQSVNTTVHERISSFLFE